MDVSETQSIYRTARSIRDTSARRSYLKVACGNDPQKLAELESWLDITTDEEVIPLDQAVACLDASTAQDQAASLTRWADSQDSREVPACRLALRPGTTAGPYVVRELLGEGGMGQVYVAEQYHPVRRKVALKLIRAVGATREMIARFEAEGQALALMDHPHIAKVFDMGTTENGLPYLAMELVRGLPITEYADAHDLTTEERLQLFSQVCLAVRHAHLHGLIHRDLKPGNVLVSDIDGEHIPKVIDFGLAKAIEQPLSDKTIYTGFHRLVGTPMYMSPEQTGMGVVDIDTRSDVYSLGVLLFELLTGVTPFDREVFRSADYDEVRRMIREVDPPRPSVAVDTLPTARASTIAQHRRVDTRRLHLGLRGDLDWIVMKALEKNRDRRYESVGEFADDIQRYLNHENVRACPPSTWYRLKKFARRNTLLVTVASTILIALIATTSIATVLTIRALRAQAISDARGKLAANVLEAMRYQSSLRYLDRGELHHLAAQLDAWRTGDETVQLDYPPKSDSGPSQPSLMQLLNSWARPAEESVAQHHTAIHNLAVAPSGERFVTVDETGQVILWELSGAGHMRPVRTLGTHGEPCHAIAISPDGRRAASGSTTGHIILWDLTIESGDDPAILAVQPLQSGVETITWSADGKYIAAGARYSAVWVASADGEELFSIENDQRHEALLFSADCEELFVPTRLGIDVWSVKNKKRIRTIDTRPLTNIRTMCFAGENAQWLVAGERFHELLFVFDPQTGDIVGHIDGASNYARSLVASPNGKYVAASYSNGQIQIFELPPRDKEIRIHRADYQFQAHPLAVDCRLPVAWRDDSHFISAANDGSFKAWNLARVRHWEEFQAKDLPHLCSIYLLDAKRQPRVLAYDHLRSSAVASRLNDGIEFPKGQPSLNSARGMIAMHYEQTISIVSLKSGRIIAQIPTEITTPHSLLFSTHGQTLYACDNEQLYLWRTPDNWTTYQSLGSVELIPEAFVLPKLTDGGTTLVMNGGEGQVIELDVVSKQKRCGYQFAGKTSGIAVSHDERYLAQCHADGLQVLDRQTGETLFTKVCISKPAMLEFMPDDRVLLSAHHNGSLQATHIPTGSLLGQLFKPHSPIGTLANLTVAPDGRIVITYNGSKSRVPIMLGF